MRYTLHFILYKSDLLRAAHLQATEAERELRGGEDVEVRREVVAAVAIGLGV